MDTNFAKETIGISLEEEMRRSYLDYAMSVIVGRALPDVRDGLKPVHRRVLYAMYELNNDYNKAYKKSARIVGDVIGKYHPHGDTAVYDTIVRLAQKFSLRYPLVDGQGNFGSVDGDAAAAMRYTEVRLSKVAHQLLEHLDQETVDFLPNYDGSEQEPSILPANLPNLLINGSSGIAVGMATSIPPHNINEVINACLLLLRNPDCSIEELIDCIPAPDFPTGALIYGVSGIKEGYRTGRGRVVMRARLHVEDLDKGQRQAIIIDELPYQVNKRNLLEKIAELVNEKRIEGISDIRDESDQSGMRVVLELKKAVIADVVINHLYKNTQLQDSFSINMVALADGQPRLLNIKQIIEYFLLHRREVITRKTKFELKKAKERSHVLEGLAVALANIDRFIEIIKGSTTPNLAKQQLSEKGWLSGLVQTMLSKVEKYTNIGLQQDGSYVLSENQTEQILQMRLQRLTAIEQQKIIDEYQQIMLKISDLEDILANAQRVTDIISNDLQLLTTNFGDARRSEIVIDTSEINIEDLIIPQDMVVTLSHSGYIKTQPVTEYRVQRRGGRGKQATNTKEDDWVNTLLMAHSHDTILCFSNKGRLHWLKVYELPQGSRISRGKPINNLLNLQEDEKITAILPTTDFDESKFVVMATAMGTIKRCALSDFRHQRRAGVIAINLEDNDYLVGVAITDGTNDVMLFNSDGKTIRFAEEEVRCMGRTAKGVIGMKLPEENQYIIAMLVAGSTEEIEQTGLSFVLTATENGYGKITHISGYTKHHRGGQGMKCMTSSANNKVVAATLVSKEDDIMLLTDGGVMVRTNVAQIRETGRSAKGVILINVDENTKLAMLQRIADKDTDLEEQV
ncbi:MAG: gyrase subunit [Pseudomonadota bacterium]|jgi:DNA gyrase subunit A